MPSQMMRLFLLLGILLTVVSVDADCQPGYTSNNNKICYKVYTTANTRALAEAQCESDGGYLASPSNGFDNSYVLSLGQKVSASSMWLGIECFDGKKSECGNDDQNTFGPYNNFYTNNPSTVGNCVYISAERPAVGAWLSFNCLNLLPFVCEQDYEPQQQQPKCPSLFNFFNGICYRVIQTIMIVSDAQNACQKYTGGNLATVPSAEVNKFLNNLTISTGSSEGWIGMKCPNVVFNGDTSSCFWFDKSPVNYTNFRSSVPQNGYPYTSISHNGQWNGNTGEGFIYPICQVPPS